MKTAGKLAILGSVLLVVGCAGAFAGAAIAKSRNEGADRIVVRDTPKMAATTKDIQKLVITTVTDNIEVNYSDEATEIQVKYDDASEEKKEIYKVEINDTSFVFEHKFDFWREFMNFTWPWNWQTESDHKVLVTIPSSREAIAIIATSVSGHIRLNNDSAATSISKAAGFIGTSVSGDIALNSIETMSKVTVTSTSGNIALTEVKTGDNLTATTTSGVIRSQKCVTTEDVTFTSTSGSLTSNEIECRNFKGNTISGSITLDNADIEKSFEGNTTSGMINLSLIDEMDNYFIFVNSVSGMCNVANINDPSRPKSIKANTTSGNVEITFKA